MHHRRDAGFVLQTLEQRMMLSSTPATPRADSLGAVFDASERQTLLNRMTNLSAGTRSSLQTKLNTSIGQFDSALLSYMRNRTGVHYYFDPADTSSIGQFIVDNHVSYSDIIALADAVVDSHLFPDQASSSTYTIDLPNSINWVKPGGSTNPEFLHTLNRQIVWQNLAWSSAITGNSKYATELEYELASWSQQFQSMKTPTAWSESDQNGWLYDASTRAGTWTGAYFGFLDDSHFTGAENSLFLYKLLQHGDFLYPNAQTATNFDSNHATTLAEGLLDIALMFPEFDSAASWETTGRDLLFKTMDAQIYPDGSHVEQSPGYTINVADDILGARLLDKLNGVTWPSTYQTQLTKMIDSYWQMLSPNGNRPAIGDTFRTASYSAFLKANLIQGTTRWPAAKPRTRDVWLLGPDAVTPYLSTPATPTSLGTRGDTYAMPDSGNYVMRSDSSKDARQIIFDAGPKGGFHGHYDLLNFELFGYGRPLISDPGAYKFDSSADRAYVLSTKAHNTLNVDGKNVGAIEGSPNGSIDVSQWDVDSNHAQITATHWGYGYLDGQPVLTRSMWYDLNGTMVIVDWGEGNTTHSFQQSFNLQTEGNAANITAVQPDGSIKTKYASGGNVKIAPVSRPGQTTSRGGLTFVSNLASGDYKDDAYRYTVTQNGTFVCFVTLITAYNGTSTPNTSAVLLNNPTAGGVVQVQLTKNGVSQQINFTPPTLQHLDSKATSRGTFNDIAYDAAGNLKMVYYDRDTRNLMYAVRGTNGKWSIPQIIDLPVSTVGDGLYQYISVALDSAGNPGAAYSDGWHGDLKFAYLDPELNAWSVETVDSKGSTGLYPCLEFGRNDAPTISYYNKTKGDLILAQRPGNEFTFTTIDNGGDVGRFSSLKLDPNRPTATKWGIGYEDTSNGNYKYAIQGLFNGGTQLNAYTNYTVEDLAIAGGYVSLAFYDSGSNDSSRYKPAMSYYDANNSALRYAKATDRGSKWQTQIVASKNSQGLYTNLFFDGAGKANIFYFNKTDNKAIRAILTGSKWSFTTLGSGGREIHVSIDSHGHIAYSNLDENIGKLDVEIL